MALQKMGVQAVIEGLASFTRGMKDMASSVTSSTSTQEKGLGSLEDTIKNTRDGYLDFRTKVMDAIGMVRKVFDFAQEGAQLLMLEQAGEDLAKSFGTSMDELVDAVDEAANGTVARADIIQAANRAMLLGVASSAEEMAQLMEVAAVRGRAMGLSTTQAFDDIVTGIGRASPMILDNLGIVTGGEKVYEDYAESIGKAKDELTEAEKKQALVNIVIEDSKPLLDAAIDGVDNLASKYARFNASTKDLTDTLKKELALTVTGLIPDFDDLVSTYEKVIAIQEEFDVRRPLFRSHFVKDGEVIAKNDAELIKWAETQRESAEITRKLTTYYEDEGNVLRELGVATEDATSDKKGLTEAEERQAEVTKRVNEQYDRLKTLMKVDLTESFTEFQGKVGDLRGEIATLEGMSYLTDEQKTQLEESRDELDKTIKKWKDYTAEVIFNIAAQALERDGLTEEEAIALAKTAEGLGLVDEGYATLVESVYDSADALGYMGDQSGTFADSMQDLVDVLSDATLEAENLDEAIRNIPTTKEITVNTIYSSGKRFAMQYGGDVERGLSYVVGERGPELFIPDVSGRILSNAMTKALSQVSPGVTNAQTYQGDNLNLNIYTSAPSEDIIADFRMLKAMGSRI